MPCCRFFYVANVSLNAIRENNFSRKFPNLQYDQDVSSSITTMMGMTLLHKGNKAFL